jgi:hypothetical protein
MTLGGILRLGFEVEVETPFDRAKSVSQLTLATESESLHSFFSLYHIKSRTISSPPA